MQIQKLVQILNNNSNLFFMLSNLDINKIHEIQQLGYKWCNENKDKYSFEDLSLFAFYFHYLDMFVKCDLSNPLLEFYFDKYSIIYDKYEDFVNYINMIISNLQEGK